MSETTLSLAVAAVREQIVIAPHHPDRLRRPPLVRAPSTMTAFVRLTSGTPPAFWLRRLQARLHTDWFQQLPRRFALICGEHLPYRLPTISMERDPVSWRM